MTKDEAIEKLQAARNLGDAEQAHIEADEILCCSAAV